MYIIALYKINIISKNGCKCDLKILFDIFYQNEAKYS